MQVFTDPRFFLEEIATTGRLRFSSGGSEVAWIDARDIASVAERALLEEGHSERTYEITGPEALSLTRTAELLAAASGHPVAHREITIEDSLEGLEGFERDLTQVTFERVHAGSFARVSEAVERVTGRPARSLEAFLRDSARAFSDASAQAQAQAPDRTSANTPPPSSP